MYVFMACTCLCTGTRVYDSTDYVVLCCVVFTGGDGAGSNSAESALPWVLVEDGTSKQLPTEERSVYYSILYTCSVPNIYYTYFLCQA